MTSDPLLDSLQECEQGIFVAPLFTLEGRKRESVKINASITVKVLIRVCRNCWDSLILCNSQVPRKAELFFYLNRKARHVCSVHDKASECHLSLIPL